MKYALLIYLGTTEEAIGRLPEFEQAVIMNEYRALAQERGVYRSEQLQSVDTATTVRIESGGTLISDAESGCPDIGGLCSLEAEDLDRALELAETHPRRTSGRRSRDSPYYRRQGNAAVR